MSTDIVLNDWDREYNQMVREATTLAKTDIIPDAYKNKPENCMLAVRTARRTGLDVLTVMQSLNIIQGRPCWASQYIISRINQSPDWSGILKYEFDDQGAKTVEYEVFQGKGQPKVKKKISLQSTPRCRAYATEKATGEKVFGPWVSIEMAITDGWFDRYGSKWTTMPELMLMYRAAAFFGRLYAPQTFDGHLTVEEVQDIGYAEDYRPAVQAPVSDLAAKFTVTKVVEPEPEQVGEADTEQGQAAYDDTDLF